MLLLCLGNISLKQTWEGITCAEKMSHTRIWGHLSFECFAKKQCLMLPKKCVIWPNRNLLMSYSCSVTWLKGVGYGLYQTLSDSSRSHMLLTTANQLLSTISCRLPQNAVPSHKYSVQFMSYDTVYVIVGQCGTYFFHLKKLLCQMRRMGSIFT